MRRGIVRVALGLVCVLVLRSTSHAFFLDDQRRFDVRMRTYSQWSVMTQNSEHKGCVGADGKPTPGTCPPEYQGGDLAQIRNFYNPEFDAKLTDFTSWMGETPYTSWFSPEDLRFRFAWWGFYDYGVYDAKWAGAPWNENRVNMKARFSQSDNPGGESFTFEDQNKNAENIYAHRNRINELYVDYTKGPLFVRLGRQAISWGESDTIAQMDIMNPFDLTLGAPGFFQDVDEARIPLWTARGTLKLIDSWGPLSSTFLDTYLVPGPIDTTVPINPITAGVSPFNPDQPDPIFSAYGNTPEPQGNYTIGSKNCIPLPGFTKGVPIHPVIVDRLPRNDWHNSRWGARLTGVVGRDYTVQTWFFRTFNQAPAPYLVGPGPINRVWVGGLKPTLTDDRGFRVNNKPGDGPYCANNHLYGIKGGRGCGPKVPAVTILDRQLESSFGTAASWFSEPLNAVIRTQMSFFWGEEGAILAKKQLNPRSQLPKCSDKLGAAGFPIVPGTTCVETKPHSAPATANYMRFVVGYDRFFFFRPLNPTNSFVLVGAFQGQVNMSAINGPDYRNPNTKPGHPQTRQADPNDQFSVYVDPHDYEDQYLFEGFAQAALQTDYLHGRLSPRFVAIVDVSGMYAFQPSMIYRFTDNLLGQVAYSGIWSPARKTGIGTFRGHDMVSFRLTAQLN